MVPVVVPLLGTFTLMSSPAIKSPGLGIGVPVVLTKTSTEVVWS